MCNIKNVVLLIYLFFVKITPVSTMSNYENDKQLCKTFSNFFQEGVKALGITDIFNISNYCHSYTVNNASSVKKIYTNFSFLWC